MAAKLLTVKKAGGNRGRRFYGCTFPAEQRCDFFMWAEDNPVLIPLALEQQQLGERGEPGEQSVTAQAAAGGVATDDGEAAWRRHALCCYLEKVIILSFSLSYYRPPPTITPVLTPTLPTLFLPAGLSRCGVSRQKSSKPK
jgi:hypothetical protein